MLPSAKPACLHGNAVPFIIAIDGPAAGGKGTLAKKLSAHYHLPHLDTGLTYRFVAQTMLTHNLSLQDEEAAVKAAQKLDFGQMDKDALADNAIGEAASKIAVMPKLRQILVEKQRNFAIAGKGAVLDGRDIGTVVCPEAQIKLYVTADIETRAHRRLQEMRARGQKTDYETVSAELKRRDSRDSTRKTNPLRQAADALLIDTTKLSIEEAFRVACAAVDSVRHA